MASESAIGATTGALPGTLGPLNTGGIAFKAGVPIGGWAQLTLHENGAYNFVGQLSNTGAVPYHVGCVFAIRDAKGSVYTFARDGVAHGWDPGSSEFDWNTPGTNPALATGWPDFFESAGGRWSWRAAANFDLPTLIDGVVSTLGPVSAIIAVI